MSILIKGMDMPMNCDACPACQLWEDCFACRFTKKFANYENIRKRQDWCPLAEVPTPHGRLIDADILVKQHGEWFTEEGSEVGFIGTVETLANAQPSVIEAEE